MNIHTSIRKLSLLFITLFIALSAGLVYWQVVVAQQVTANIHNNRHCLADAAPIRGRIFDRKGRLLAYSERSSKATCGYVRHYIEPSLANLIGYYISPLFPATGIEKEYDQYLSGQRGLTLLNNTINQTLHRPPVGDDIYLTIDLDIQRIVKHAFDTYVATPEGRNIFATHRGSVVVTDPHTGEILALLSCPGYNTNRNPAGDTSDCSGYDPNRIAAGDLNYFHILETDPSQPLLERPLQFRTVPGSTYKTFTLLAGLDSGHANLSDLYYNDHNPDHPQAIGPIVVGRGDETETIGPVGNNLCCYTKRYPVSLAYGFVHSDNIIFAQVGVSTGAQSWLDYSSRFYVGKQIPFDLPVAVSTVLPAGKTHLGVNQLAENSFGQGVDFVTPFQMSLFDDAIANNGTLMKPWLVWKVVQPDHPTDPAHPTDLKDIFCGPVTQNANELDGQITPCGTEVQTVSPQELGTPISQQTASQVRDAMYGVVRCGSGSIVPELYNSPWAIIAKTGTGEVGGGNPAMAWLLTQAPYRDPKLTIVGMKENGGEGGYVDGPMIAHMYNDIYSNVLKLPLPPAPDPQNPYCFDNGLLQA